MKVNPRIRKPKALWRIGLCALILAVGYSGMCGLAAMKQPPKEAMPAEQPLRVEVISVAPEDVSVAITGHGQAAPVKVVALSSEVSGRITDVYPRCYIGELVKKGGLLFQIDPQDYDDGVREAQATVAQIENSLERLRQQQRIDKRRWIALQRNRELAAREHHRLKQLFDQDGVGSRSNVEAAERAANLAADQDDQMAQTVELYPIRIQETRHSLSAARARLDVARARRRRCDVYAPFDGRIEAVFIEKGQYVSAGQQAVTMADDSVLEIQVPIDSRDAKNWLRFDAGTRFSDAWFGPVSPVACNVRWTEAPDGSGWCGTLDRVVRFDQKTRTLTVAVRVVAAEAQKVGTNGLPLVEGMFCSVKIPGRAMKGVFRVPRWAVSFKNTVYVALNDRLKTVPVTVARSQGDETFISDGLKKGDRVISTRLVDPLENSLLGIDRQ
jgi:RND family efflux transporter MFP subunit